MKFALNGDQGPDIFEQGYPNGAPISRDPKDRVDAMEQTLSDDTSHLHYADKAWASPCRQLVVELDNGSTYVANFKSVK